MRSWFSFIALLLCAVAAVVSWLDGKSLELGFFIAAAVLASVQAWCVRAPYDPMRMRLARSIAVAWTAGAIWIGVLLMMYQSAARPPALSEETYLGLTSTVYHLVGVYGGTLAVLVAAFAPFRSRSG